MAKKALLVIDVQEGIVRGPGIHDADGIMKKIRSLQELARKAGAPVLFMQHDGPKGHRVEKGTDGWKIHPAVKPAEGETVLNKEASDSFFHTFLQQELKQYGVSEIVISGCMTQYCVDTTCRRAVTLGFDVTLVSDAHTTADEGGLTAQQIIKHHNTLLNGFDAGGHEVSVKKSSEITFA